MVWPEVWGYVGEAKCSAVAAPIPPDAPVMRMLRAGISAFVVVYRSIQRRSRWEC